MKYIKTFEYLLKHSDNAANNNIFKPFAEKLKSLLLLLKKSDGLNKSTVKIYYDSSGEITIKYNYKYVDLYTFRLITYNRITGLELNIISNYIYIQNEYTSNNKILSEVFNTVIESFEIDHSDYYPTSHIIKIDDVDDLSILDNIYNDVNTKLEIVVNAKKFNL